MNFGGPLTSVGRQAGETQAAENLKIAKSARGFLACFVPFAVKSNSRLSTTLKLISDQDDSCVIANSCTQAFPTMLGQYYDLMGWDRWTGNPTPGKSLELSLEWTI